jgi:hypothetical protein
MSRPRTKRDYGVVLAMVVVTRHAFPVVNAEEGVVCMAN